MASKKAEKVKYHSFEIREEFVKTLESVFDSALSHRIQSAKSTVGSLGEYVSMKAIEEYVVLKSLIMSQLPEQEEKAKED